MPISARLLQRIIEVGDDPNDWESESDNDDGDDETRITVPELLPVPNLSKPNDSLCDTCRSLNLTPRRFVVLPGDGETTNKPDDPNIKLGTVKDVKSKSNCPFCRLVLKALFKDEIVEVEDGEPVEVTMSWNTDGPSPDPDQPWHHIPQIRVLRPYAQKVGGGYINIDSCNMFPEITLLANDAPTPSKSYFARLIKDQIDFGMVKNWFAMCHEGHADFCNQSKLLDRDIKDPANEIPSFRLIDVVDNCIIPAPHNCQYVALSYVWGPVDPSNILRLLNSNVSDLRRPGALVTKENQEKIPATIRDAMQVVRELGLRYMWTDSLCIIQDDTGYIGSTKIDAISKMDLVYGTAYTTIIAASGANANAGLPGLHPGSRGVSQPIEEIGPGFRLAFKPRAADLISTSVHSTRAWTFQERLFSRRNLTFIGGQIVFGCRKAHEWREDQVFEDRHRKTHGVVGSRDKNPDDIGEFEGLIQSYPGLALTFRGDIYNAFAGLTRYFKTDLKATLCHGIPDKYFDWFLIWDPLDAQTRQPDAPSWSWSGWSGSPFPRIWDWYNRSISRIRVAQRKRTWIIWYQRRAHDSEDCIRIWTPKADVASPSRGPRNFYGGHVQQRFPFDCTRTEPTPRLLAGAPEYIHDTYNPNPGSGFLQFWTVSAMFKLDQASTPSPKLKPKSGYTRLGIFGKGGLELGNIFVHPDWCKNNVPKSHEFILICEARDERAQNGRIDDEPGWRYMVMLIEWHGEWAERVAVGWIKKRYLTKALGDGPVWKEIILG
ncbi:hypothetical protein CVT25_002335 [Psilocybe cyanescens]|uniref:Heterokaryon incompatibility domain-containing protein n=1 Tax=Psilocybe cyanescens TaxID=93625 RepID=A0A409WKI2_PSICY|nr:hypothetical protein CVT25_002335 [Psilocybe cyanescens]